MNLLQQNTRERKFRRRHYRRKSWVKVRVGEGDTAHTAKVTGREAWALEKLIKAGPKGCTSLTHPGPRWSSYIHALRHEHGIQIETQNERHGGPFAGTHALYVLQSAVTIIERFAPESEAA